MNIRFKTNIDNYQTNCFPTNLTFIPRIGEKVCVVETFKTYFREKKLPTRLEVVDVIYSENEVVCELWYNSNDKYIADLNGAKTL